MYVYIHIYAHVDLYMERCACTCIGMLPSYTCMSGGRARRTFVETEFFRLRQRLGLDIMPPKTPFGRSLAAVGRSLGAPGRCAEQWKDEAVVRIETKKTGEE